MKLADQFQDPPTIDLHTYSNYRRARWDEFAAVTETALSKNEADIGRAKVTPHEI